MLPIHVVVLAAGQGTRMKSLTPKVLHKAAGKTLLEHVINQANQLKPKSISVVVPKEHGEFVAALEGLGKLKQKIKFTVQDQQLGTGHALKCGLMGMTIKEGAVLVINGDMPLIARKTLKTLISKHNKEKNVATFLSTLLDNPFGLGRILRDSDQKVVGIREEKDATSDERKIQEINVGAYVFDIKFLKESIGKIKNNNKQKEYYLPDLIRMACEKKLNLNAFVLAGSIEAMGVNTPADLHIVSQILYSRQREKFMKEGVCLSGHDIFIDYGVKVGAGTSIESPCYLKSGSVIENNVMIETGCVIKNSKIKSNALLKAYSYLDQAVVGNECQVGPFAHLRPKANLSAKAKVGNFAEIKKSQIGPESKVNHLSYIGDAVIGKKVNVGAGTITCNYDGFNKFKTVLGDEVFIGSDTQLVAPVTVSKGAIVGAGTTVTKNVSAQSLVLTRPPQIEIKGWATKFRKNKAKNKK